MNLHSFLILALIFASLSSFYCQDQNPNFTLPVPKFNHKTRFCGLPNDPEYRFDYNKGADQCDLPAYGKALAIMAAPALVMFAIALLGSIVLIFFMCCGCCRGPKRNKCVMFIVLGLAIACAIVGLIVTQTGNVYISRAADSLGETITNTLNHAVGVFDNVSQEIIDLNLTFFDEDFQIRLNETREQFVEFNTSAQNTRDTITYYDNLRRTAMFIGSIVPSVMIAVGLILMLFGLRIPIGIIGWFCLFLSMLVWLSLIVHLLSAKLVSDVCWEVELSMQLNEAGPLTLLMECNNEDGFVGSLRVELLRALDEATTEACDKINEMCTDYSSVVYCGTYVCEDVESILEVPNITIDDNGVNRTIIECSTDCTSSTIRSIAVEAISVIDKFGLYYDVYLRIVRQIDCQFVIDAFLDIKDTLCDKLVFAMQQIFAGNALIGIGMTIGCIALIHVFKGDKKVD